MSNAPAARDVAEFMKERLYREERLWQEDVVHEIAEKFGSDFAYINDNGNPAIDRKVLKEFRKITPDVVWERAERCWRFRQEYDGPESRMQE